MKIIKGADLKSLSKETAATSPIITLERCFSLSLCFVDSRYQGMRTHKHLNRLRNKWDERKLTPIILVWHPEEHRFAIVDGQGTHWYIYIKRIFFHTIFFKIIYCDKFSFGIYHPIFPYSCQDGCIEKRRNLYNRGYLRFARRRESR